MCVAWVPVTSYALQVASVFACANPPLLLRFYVVRCCVVRRWFGLHRHVGHPFVRVTHGLDAFSSGSLSSESMFAACSFAVLVRLVVLVYT